MSYREKKKLQKKREEEGLCEGRHYRLDMKAKKTIPWQLKVLLVPLILIVGVIA